MRNWRTTAAGIVIIVGGVATFVGQWIAGGVPDGSAWGALGAALAAGGGFIAAADGKNVQP